MVFVLKPLFFHIMPCALCRLFLDFLLHVCLLRKVSTAVLLAGNNNCVWKSLLLHALRVRRDNIRLVYEFLNLVFDINCEVSACVFRCGPLLSAGTASASLPWQRVCRRCSQRTVLVGLP